MVLLDTDICIYLLNQRPGFESILKHLDGREYGEVSRLVSSLVASDGTYQCETKSARLPA